MPPTRKISEHVIGIVCRAERISVRARESDRVIGRDQPVDVKYLAVAGLLARGPLFRHEVVSLARRDHACRPLSLHAVVGRVVRRRPAECRRQAPCPVRHSRGTRRRAAGRPCPRRYRASVARSRLVRTHLVGHAEVLPGVEAGHDDQDGGEDFYRSHARTVAVAGDGPGDCQLDGLGYVGRRLDPLGH